MRFDLIIFNLFSTPTMFSPRILLGLSSTRARARPAALIYSFISSEHLKCCLDIDINAFKGFDRSAVIRAPRASRWNPSLSRPATATNAACLIAAEFKCSYILLAFRSLINLVLIRASARSLPAADGTISRSTKRRRVPRRVGHKKLITITRSGRGDGAKGSAERE